MAAWLGTQVFDLVFVVFVISEEDLEQNISDEQKEDNSGNAHAFILWASASMFRAILFLCSVLGFVTLVLGIVLLRVHLTKYKKAN